MPKLGKVLSFPDRRLQAAMTAAQAEEMVSAYLVSCREGRDLSVQDAILSDPDLLMLLLNRLRARINAEPKEVEAEAAFAFLKIGARETKIGFFDEREYFMGEMALLAASAARLVGTRQDTELWLDRAEASYRHVVNSEPHLARTAYVRLALRYDMRRYSEVLELLPSVALTFNKVGMIGDLARCWFLEAMTLKDLGNSDRAEHSFRRLVSDQRVAKEPGWVGAALVHLGSLLSDRGDLVGAIDSYQQARPLLEAAEQLTTLADLKMMIGDTLRRSGNVSDAFEAYRESIRDYMGLGMAARASYLRVVLAEGLLEAGRPREAEWEILAALGTIEEHQMAPEGLLAIGLLRESVAQQKADPDALTRVREYLKAANN